MAVLCATKKHKVLGKNDSVVCIHDVIYFSSRHCESSGRNKTHNVQWVQSRNTLHVIPFTKNRDSIRFIFMYDDEHNLNKLIFIL